MSHINSPSNESDQQGIHVDTGKSNGVSHGSGVGIWGRPTGLSSIKSPAKYDARETVDRESSNLTMAELQRLQENLKALRSKRDRELEELKRQAEQIQARAQQINQELAVIDGKSQAVRAAIRTLEDHGLA